jgi:hypothetical protein
MRAEADAGTVGNLRASGIDIGIDIGIDTLAQAPSERAVVMLSISPPRFRHGATPLPANCPDGVVALSSAPHAATVIEPP